MTQGPSVTELTRWLADIPGDFLGYLPEQGDFDISALVSDLLLTSGQPALNKQEAAQYHRVNYPKNRNCLQILLYICHILNHPFFHDSTRGNKIRACLAHKWWSDLSALKEHSVFIQDSLRREELVRVVLHLMEVQPAGESREHAQDRLKTLDSLEEKKIEEQSQAARKRVQEIREAMARQAAEEAASKMSRE